MHFVLQLFRINAFYLGDNPAGSFSLSFSSSFSFSFNSSKSITYRIDMRKKGALSLKYYLFSSFVYDIFYLTLWIHHCRICTYLLLFMIRAGFFTSKGPQRLLNGPRGGGGLCLR